MQRYHSYYKTAVVAIVLFLGASCASQSNERSQAQDNTQQSSGNRFAYIGKPGPIPHTKTMPAPEYGAYTFASPLNFCRGARWIISGTMAPLWPDEPKPLLVKRGTAIEVIDEEHIDCSTLDDRLSMVSGDLVHYRPAGGGQDRYVASTDVFSQSQYNDYANREAQLRHALAMRPRVAQAPAPLISPGPLVAQYGYEEALNKTINENVDATVTHNAPCSVPAAQYYLDQARGAFVSKDYIRARTLSWSAWEYSGSCNEKRGSQEQGDALLIFSKAEIRLGNLTGGKNDADASASSFADCASAEDVYDQATRDYCAARRSEAHDIVQNG